MIKKYVDGLSIERLREELLSLHIKYDERGMAMRDTGAVVRSLYVPAIGKLVTALHTISKLPDRNAATIAQDALDEYYKGPR